MVRNLFSTRLLACLFFLWIGWEEFASGQDQKFRERFAISSDRETLLRELIPGTEGYFLYHSLHYQNVGRIAEARKFLEDWESKLGHSQSLDRMRTRQSILEYTTDPDGSRDYLLKHFGIQIDHPAPQRDEAAHLASTLSPSVVDWEGLVRSSLQVPRRLSSIEDSALGYAFPMVQSKEDLWDWLARVRHPDTRGLLEAIERELRLPDSRGFGWCPIYQELTVEQLASLVKQFPSLLQSDKFVEIRLQKIRPREGERFSDRNVRLQHLEELESFVSTLPDSQNSLKANILYQRLLLDEQRGIMDRDRFLRFLRLPNTRWICNPAFREQSQSRNPIRLDAGFQNLVLLEPIRDDSKLIERYLIHFFLSDPSYDDFANWLDREYLKELFSIAKILYGIGDPKRHYATLTAEKQKEISERVELVFAPTNQETYSEKDRVSLQLILKNTPDLVIKIYQLNPRNLLRSGETIHTGLDVDGLIPNGERRIEYAFPSDRRHVEQIPLPELEGPGVWIVDLLASGVRSRALIQKGSIQGLHSLSDTGNVIRIVDNQGNHLPDATVWFGDREYSAEQDGNIVLPFANDTKTESVILLHGKLASKESFVHHSEEFQLEARFLCDSQQFISGSKAKVVLRPTLFCNGRLASISELERIRLRVKAKDLDGIESLTEFPLASLSYDEDTVQEIAIPPRLAEVVFELRAEIRKLSNQVRIELTSSHSLSVNQTVPSAISRDLFLQEDTEGLHLNLLGRNGEPIARQPLRIELKLHGLVNTISTRLATDDKGSVHLGTIPELQWIKAEAVDAPSRVFRVDTPPPDSRDTMHFKARTSITLPLPTAFYPESRIALYELRGGSIVRDWSGRVTSSLGFLSIPGLEPGLYRLVDHAQNRSIAIKVFDGVLEGSQLKASSWVGEFTNPNALTILSREWKEGKIAVRIANATPSTRVHLFAATFVPVSNVGGAYHRRASPLHATDLHSIPSLYVNSMKLDEEYQYVLHRRSAKIYPGNMLSTPSVLLQPWELATTQNFRSDAEAGDALPKLAPGSAAPAPARASEPLNRELKPAGVPEYEFLSRGAILAANLQPNSEGWVIVDATPYREHPHLTVVVVDRDSTVSAKVLGPRDAFSTIDRRLRTPLDPKKHFHEEQKTLVLSAGREVSLGEIQSTRFKVFSTLRDVYELCLGILGADENFTKFEFLTRWDQFTSAEKKKYFGAFNCHEMNFFLYRHDPRFFMEVVRPYLINKSSKQFLDDYLLEKDLDSYTQPWRYAQLNTLERVLLAKRLASQYEPEKRAIRDWLLANPTPLRDLQAGLEVGLQVGRVDRFEKGTDGYLQSMESLELKRGLVSDQAALGGMAGLAEPSSPSSPPSSSGYGFGAGEKQQSMRRSLGRESVAGKKDRTRLYEEIEQTRKWAETHYYRIPLEQQSPNRIRPNAFWMDLLYHDDREGKFISSHIQQAAENSTAGWMAIAALDLPMSADSVSAEVREGQYALTPKSSAIAFIRGISETKESGNASTVLLNQQIYAVSEPVESAKPIQRDQLIRGTVYRLRTVITNPDPTPWMGQLVQQIPQGSLPIANAKPTMAHIVDLKPFASQEIASLFYFPESGTFSMVGSQLSQSGTHVTRAPEMSLTVHAKPAAIDESSWQFVSTWGTDQQLLEFLSKQNLFKLSLDSIAWRMKDKDLFEKTLDLLKKSGVYHEALWAYSLHHRDKVRMREYLENKSDIVEAVAPGIRSEILTTDADSRRAYEHLDFRPLVLARAHPIGSKSQLLNDGLISQYERFLQNASYQVSLEPIDRLSFVYYLLLQNRIDEALDVFAGIARESLESKLQYDYMDMYLAFFKLDLDRALVIADRYRDYPHPRWNSLFQEAGNQIAERRAMESGKRIANDPSIDWTDASDQRLLGGERERQNALLAASEPLLDMIANEQEIVIRYRELSGIRVNFYWMDIELQFSRAPFVTKDSSRLSLIEANHSEWIALPKSSEIETYRFALPDEMRNRNVLVEVSAAGLTSSTMIYSNSLRVNLAPNAGRLQVIGSDRSIPLEATYIKVYRRSSDGKVAFYKDGYTDIRGQFDYASLSLDELGSIERFAILVLHPKHGASVHEVLPPRR